MSLTFTLLVNVPGVWATPKTSVVEYLNVTSSVTETWNSPLYPTLYSPVVFVVLFTFLIATISPVWRLCGSSEMTVTVFEAAEQVLINLGFLLYS